MSLRETKTKEKPMKTVTITLTARDLEILDVLVGARKLNLEDSIVNTPADRDVSIKEKYLNTLSELKAKIQLARLTERESVHRGAFL